MNVFTRQILSPLPDYNQIFFCHVPFILRHRRQHTIIIVRALHVKLQILQRQRHPLVKHRIEFPRAQHTVKRLRNFRTISGQQEHSYCQSTTKRSVTDTRRHRLHTISRCQTGIHQNLIAVALTPIFGTFNRILNRLHGRSHRRHLARPQRRRNNRIRRIPHSVRMATRAYPTTLYVFVPNKCNSPPHVNGHLIPSLIMRHTPRVINSSINGQLQVKTLSHNLTPPQPRIRQLTLLPNGHLRPLVSPTRGDPLILLNSGAARGFLVTTYTRLTSRNLRRVTRKIMFSRQVFKVVQSMGSRIASRTALTMVILVTHRHFKRTLKTVNGGHLRRLRTLRVLIQRRQRSLHPIRCNSRDYQNRTISNFLHPTQLTRNTRRNGTIRSGTRRQRTVIIRQRVMGHPIHLTINRFRRHAVAIVNSFAFRRDNRHYRFRRLLIPHGDLLLRFRSLDNHRQLRRAFGIHLMFHTGIRNPDRYRGLHGHRQVPLQHTLLVNDRGPKTFTRYVNLHFHHFRIVRHHIRRNRFTRVVNTTASTRSSFTKRMRTWFNSPGIRFSIRLIFWYLRRRQLNGHLGTLRVYNRLVSITLGRPPRTGRITPVITVRLPHLRMPLKRHVSQHLHNRGTLTKGANNGGRKFLPSRVSVGIDIVCFEGMDHFIYDFLLYIDRVVAAIHSCQAVELAHGGIQG